MSEARLVLPVPRSLGQEGHMLAQEAVDTAVVRTPDRSPAAPAGYTLAGCTAAACTLGQHSSRIREVEGAAVAVGHRTDRQAGMLAALCTSAGVGLSIHNRTSQCPPPP